VVDYGPPVHPYPGAYGDDPVSYEFVSGSLTEGLKKVADRQLRPLRLELRKAEARLQAYEREELSRVEKRIAREEVPNSERYRIERSLQSKDLYDPYRDRGSSFSATPR
jgi:hypothetical protein